MELDEAVESFWDRFLLERGDFVSFALSEADRFEPNTFIPDFLARIHLARWCRKDDCGFAVARLIMDRLRLAVARNLEDGDEFVCSIYDLEKKIKKRIRKKGRRNKLLLGICLRWKMRFHTSGMGSSWRGSGRVLSDSVERQSFLFKPMCTRIN